MKKALLASLALLVVGALGAAGFWYFTERRLTRFAITQFGTPEEKRVRIPPGTTPHGVARLLAGEKVVSSEQLLYAWLRREKLGPKLKAGEYEFSGAITPKEVIEKLTAGQVKQYHFTIPEGLRVDEILPIVASSELELSLDKLKQIAATPELARKLGVPADSFEGFLFPDTYSFPRGVKEEGVLKRMVWRTLEQVKAATRKPGIELDLLQAVTLASIVEKETGAAAERPRISCVFHNRLKLKMKLQTDPTVIYAMMLLKGRYSKSLNRADLQTEHPYNTYAVKGLPPGPIASPGSAAITAALNPIECDDLFFVSRNDGTHVFCPDLACHNAAVQKWQIDFHQKH
ncbi:MAG: hypothetical protein H6Q89_1098 [Myxococcaceae bacterium]|nr:hypothetical protein [Myxococcaceae bacterium]